MLLKIFKEIINKPIIIYCILGFIIYLQFSHSISLKQDVNRLQNNVVALSIDQSIQQQMTIGEFKKLQHKEDSIAKIIGIKPNQLQNIIVNNYHYKDTTIVEIPLQPKDSISKDTLQFIASIKCTKIEGEVINNKKVRIINIELNDTLHTFVYKKYNNRFLFIKWNKYYDAITYSECTKKNINVEKNIKIIK